MNLILLCMIILAGCSAPLFRSEEELFKPAPEVITQLEPYLEKWSTSPFDKTEAERIEIA